MRVILIGALCAALPGAVLAQETSDLCVRCHVNALSLEDWDRDALAQRIRELSADGASHVTPIPTLSDEELAALVRALAGP